jgi:hypothetical protein
LIVLVGTHNSFISAVNGIGVEEESISHLLHKINIHPSDVVIGNQRLSLLDQLKLGVRHLELDIHQLPLVTGETVRLCHWDIAPFHFPPLVSYANWKVSKSYLAFYHYQINKRLVFTIIAVVFRPRSL